jgi:arginyl-tRNA synthetase
MESIITDLLITNAQELFGAQIQPTQIQLQKTRKEFSGDVTLVTFPFAKLAGTSPDQIAERIGSFICSQLPQITGLCCISLLCSSSGICRNN